MSGDMFFASLWHLIRGSDEFRGIIIQEAQREKNIKKYNRRVKLLIQNLPVLEDHEVRQFLQEMIDEPLVVHTLGMIREQSNGLALNRDPGLEMISESDVQLIQIYAEKNIRNIQVSQNVVNEALMTLQPIYGFLEGWESYQGTFDLERFLGFKAFIGSTSVQDLLLTLSLIVQSLDSTDQHQLLQRMAFLNFHYLFWFNAYENDPNFREPLLRGMALSILYWILMGNDHLPTGSVTFKHIQGNRVGPIAFPNGVSHIFANTLTRSLQHHRDESIEPYHELFDTITTMGQLDVFAERFGVFIRQYQKTPYYQQTIEALRFLIEQTLEHMPEDACWISLVDYARMFLLAEDRFLERLNKSSEDCLRSLLDHARENLARDDEPELLHDTSEFLLLQPVKGRWDQSLKSLIINRLKKALSDDSAADGIMQKQFPLLPLLEQCTTWLGPPENLGVSYIPFGQRMVERLGQYFANQFHPAFSVKTLLDIADHIFSTGDFNTFVDALGRKLTEIMPAVNEERYKECFAPFIQKPLARSAVHKDRIEEIARKTVQQGLQPRLVLFLRDILHAYRVKQKRKWKDTVGLRNNIQNLRQRGDLSKEIEQMLSEIEEMIR